MKRKKIPFLLILSFNIFLPVSCSEKGNDIDLSAGSLPDHPRILLFNGEEEMVRENLKSDPVWQSVNNMIFTECNAIISRPPVERLLIGRRLLDKSREALKRIFYLSYAYRMSGVKSYFDRAEKEMLAVAAFQDWNPSHFLDVAEMTMAVSIGYDWLYSSLSESSRNTIRDAIIQKGLNPSLETKYSSWLNAVHNWNQVCNAGMTFGALAVYESDSVLARKIIDRALLSILKPMAEYNPDGVYPEGYGYWGYGSSFNIMFLSAWEKVYRKEFDLSKNPGFLKTAEYMMNMRGPTGLNFNYSDNGQGTSVNPSILWFSRRLTDKSVLWEEKKMLDKLTSAKERLMPAALIWSAGLKTSEITEPLKKCYTGQGKNPVALMRTSWNDPDAIFVGIKGGSPKVNHAHMDVGSFVLDANGVRWAMDFGAQDYNSLEQAGVDLWNMSQTSERWQVFRYNNFAHNTLAVNNQLQKVDGYAAIISSSSSANMMNAITDISQVYSGQLKKAVRGAAIADQAYVVIRDEIETGPAETTIRWILLTPAAVNITGADVIELSKDGRKMIVKIDCATPFTIKTWSTTSSNSYDAPNPGTFLVGFETVVPANTAANLQVCFIPEGVVQNPATLPGALSTWPK
jgi:hypothetical protein